jgi:hypothetical protein
METKTAYKVIGWHIYKMRLIRETANFHVFWKHEKEVREAKNPHMPVFTKLVNAVNAALANLNKKREEAQRNLDYLKAERISINLK